MLWLSELTLFLGDVPKCQTEIEDSDKNLSKLSGLTKIYLPDEAGRG